MSETTTSPIKSEIKENLSLSVPLVASQLVFASSGFIGTALVAKLGEDALAASVLVSMIWLSLSVFFFGILNSISILVSHQYGAKNNRGISEIMGQGFILGILITIIMVALLFSMPLFLHLSTQPPIVLKLATQYMYAMIFTIPGLILLIIHEQFLAGIHQTKLVLRISLIVVPIEIPIIYLLIFGKFGLPAFGVAGIGYGFAITYTSAAIALSFYLLKSHYFQHFAIFNKLTSLNLKLLSELIRIGIPMGFMLTIEVSTFAVATFWIGQFGTTILAAHQIVVQYLSFAITLIFAMAQAVTVRVGYAFGRRNLSEIKNAIKIGMVLNFLCIVFVAIAFNVIPNFFLRLDINLHDPLNASLIHDATLLLGISGILLLFDNFRIIGFGALRGLKDTKFPMYSSFISFWMVGLSAAFLLGFICHLGAKGIWFGLTLGVATGAFIVLMRIRYLLKKDIFAKM